jgi:hypothetical protein
VIVGGVLGSIAHPEVVIAALYTSEGELAMIGRTVPPKPDQSKQLAAALEPAKKGHPWPDEISSQRWGGRYTRKPLIKVTPVVVAEVSAHAATQAGQVRHGMRYRRSGQTSLPTTLNRSADQLRRQGVGKVRLMGG